ncbi:hypothetical protein C1646_777027 [Rhizophagus diaphanus]|nr:hypothetical protein C1646_777027 [Rhizophagus diaphanus] [Rhizophagus sp. MUCL 43196]
MKTYEITFEEKTSLYYSSQEIFSEETEEEFDTSFDELSDNENKEEFDIYKDQEVPLPSVEDANEPVYRLNPAIHTNFSPFGTWQIDENAVSEYQSKEIPLGVCMNHFNYDQKNYNAFTKQFRGIGCKDHLWKIWEKYIQIPCVGLYICNAVHECQGNSQQIFDNISTIRYICYNCYESYSEHLNRRPGSGK